MNICNLVKQYAPLLGRFLLALLFVLSGYTKIGNFDAVAGMMASKGLPMAQVLLALTILIELGGGLMIMLGWHARWAAAIIFLWLIPVTLLFHRFWGIDPAQAQAQFNNFFKNVSIAGGMLYILAYGSGPFSITRDRCGETDHAT